MFAKTYSAVLQGIKALLVEVEVSANQGLKNFSIVGLGDKSIAEAKERVSSAIKNSKLSSPNAQAKRIVVNLSPADLKKEGSHFDLPIALSYLLATNQTRFNLDKRIFFGEIALSGEIKPVKGVFSFTLMAKEKNFKEIFVPKENAKEACFANLLNPENQIKVVPVETLNQTLAFLENKVQMSFACPKEAQTEIEKSEVQWGWIKGQNHAKKGMEIAIAGCHHLFLQGPPGTGKTLLAKAAVSIMPKLSQKEILEISKIYSAAGLLSEKNPVLLERPFRSPHHSISEAALIGGGNPLKPGEITLAHSGILFLDEFPEFHRNVLESLRQPIEQGTITIQRVKESFCLPARFSLIAASNPCPCGNYQSPNKECSCNQGQISSYKRKLVGPLIDRFDIFCWVPSLTYEELVEQKSFSDLAESPKEKISKAREIQNQRFAKESISTNSEMNIEQIKKHCQIDSESNSLLKKYVDSGKLSARGFHKILKVSRTIADLANKETIDFQDVAEALSYRPSQD